MGTLPHITSTQDDSDQSMEHFHWQNASIPQYNSGDSTSRHFPNRNHISWPATYGYHQPYYLYPPPYEPNATWQYLHYPQTTLMQPSFQPGLFPTHTHVMGVSAGVAYGEQSLIQHNAGTRRRSSTFSVSQPTIIQPFPHHPSIQSIAAVARPTFGPPRRPRQSGFALWVGNLPPRIAIVDLKDYFSNHFTTDIESLKLIRKTNCAFVNYRTATACAAAAERFHESAFQGRQLVCRQRKTELSSQHPQSPQGFFASEALTISSAPSPKPQPSSSQPYLHLPARYIILKSLTSRDLTLSTQTSTWITQPHNEPVLNAAFDACDTLYLIFSANKSGEFFGIATMVAKIPPLADTTATSVSSADADATTPVSSLFSGTPHDVPSNGGAARITMTDATQWAPKGMIYEDVARGVIYWEAAVDEEQNPIDDAAPAADATNATIGRSATGNNEGSEQQPCVDVQSSPNSPMIARDGISSPIVSSSNPEFPSLASPTPNVITEVVVDALAASNYTAPARSFRVQWLSTKRVLFHRTRGLRNAWNDGKEVKVARDGTEVESEVGKKLVEMFW